MARYEIKGFKSHGYYCIDSSLIIEVQISNTGDEVRYRITSFNFATGENTIYIGYWQPIRYTDSHRPYIKDWHGNKATGKPSRKYKRLYLDLFIRTNQKLFTNA